MRGTQENFFTTVDTEDTEARKRKGSPDLDPKGLLFSSVSVFSVVKDPEIVPLLTRSVV
jgi:hypothetical protein